MQLEFVYDKLGNIECGVTENGMKVTSVIPDYNVIVKDDSLSVVREKQKAQKKAFDKFSEPVEISEEESE